MQHTAQFVRYMAVFVSCLGFGAGCIFLARPVPPASYVLQAAIPLPPGDHHRLLLLPPTGEGVDPGHVALLLESLRLALAAEGYFVVAPPASALDHVPDGLTEDPQVLATLADKARADLVLYVQVLDYRPYPPPRIALLVKAYGPGVGDVLWQLTGVWDLNDANVSERYRQFRRNGLEPELARLQHRAVIEAPREFLRYVAFEVAHALATEPMPPVVADRPGAGTSTVAPEVLSGPSL